MHDRWSYHKSWGTASLSWEYGRAQQARRRMRSNARYRTKVQAGKCEGGLQAQVHNCRHVILRIIQERAISESVLDRSVKLRTPPLERQGLLQSGPLACDKGEKRWYAAERVKEIRPTPFAEYPETLGIIKKTYSRLAIVRRSHEWRRVW
jgi:hypothetical protein